MMHSLKAYRNYIFFLFAGSTFVVYYDIYYADTQAWKVL